MIPGEHSKTTGPEFYKGSISLLTDFYQLSMAYGYWKSDTHNKEAVFNLFFRNHPFKGGYTITSGLEYCIQYIGHFFFSDDDLEYLAGLKNEEGGLIFDTAFIEYLRTFRFTCDIDAIPEGTLVFPNQPLLRVKGSLIQCQLLETPLLNFINFQSLIATKAARICQAAKDDKVLEFGLRRAQGMDGGIAASRAAYIGGCHATSNVLAGKIFNIPVSGTHAHSWVMSFDSEIESFEVYAKAMPDNCVFLVDTYDTIKGIENAIAVGYALQAKGKKLRGVRIDSGDLAYFSNRARIMLDEAGFTETKIVASNDLDEYLIHSLKEEQDAPIQVWGVGTRLVTAYDQPALGAVFKMSALRNTDGNWEDKIKISAQSVKVNNPGLQQVRRFYNEQNQMIGDMIYDENQSLEPHSIMLDPADPTRKKRMKNEEGFFADLLVPIFRGGRLIYTSPGIHNIRDKVKQELETLDRTFKRFTNPHNYPVGLEKSLLERKLELIIKHRRIN
jgi:nicotinate phosphoribosyltransferase